VIYQDVHVVCGSRVVNNNTFKMVSGSE